MRRTVLEFIFLSFGTVNSKAVRGKEMGNDDGI